MPIIICLSGLIGAGKTTILDLLTKELRLKHFSVSVALSQRAGRANQPVNQYAKKLIENMGKTGIIRMMLLQIKRQLKGEKGIVIESIFRPEELELIKQTFPNDDVFLFAINARKQLRIRRVMKREGIGKHKARVTVRIWDSRRNEYGFEKMKKLADLVLSSEQKTKKKTQEEIEKAIKKKQVLRMIKAIKQRHA
ncbi:MAG: AAA family ATPase [archaeon]|nr:AAA family ATPase [archaeon]